MENGVDPATTTDSVENDDLALETLRGYVNEYVQNSTEERQWAEVHRDYFDDKQWTAEEIATLNARGQPVITDNKIKDKVEYMEGVERKTRSDPKAYPRTPVHEEDADVATDALRYIFDDNRFSMTKSAVFQNLLIEGFGGCEVINDKDDPKQILIRKIRWDRLIRDPFSLEPDCSDGRYDGFVTWMDQSYALEKYKGKKSILESTYQYNGRAANGDSLDDHPNWVDSKRKRVAVYTLYVKRKGKIFHNVFCWGGKLEPSAECAYKDEDGKHESPIILTSAYIDREGRRYGLVKRYISLQDEVNKRRSKSLHLLNTKRLLAETGAFPDGIAKAREQLHLPDGALEFTQGFKVEVQDNNDLSAGHFQLLQQAEMALSATGPNAALLGQSGSISGRAKELDQQGGALQIGVLFDSIRDWQLRVAKACWNRVRQFWDEEMMIRVTDSEIGIKFVKLNERTTKGELAAKQLKGKPPEEVAPMLEQIAMDPMSKLPAVANDVSQLDVDIIIDEAPDVITLQAEEFEKLTQLAGTGVIQIPPDALIEASGLRSETKKRIMDIIKGTNDPMAQQRAQMQEMMVQLEGMLKQAQVQKTQAEAGLTDAKEEQIRASTVTNVATAMTPDPLPPEKAQPAAAAG